MHLKTINIFHAFGKPARKLAVFTLLSAMAAGAFAELPFRFEEDFDEQNKPWQEIAVQLPALPKKDNLLTFYVSPTTTYNFAIDAASLSIGSDGVVRYTLVATSGAGAENISYEGIRCQSSEKKIYALGHKDATWSRSRRDQWEPISHSTTNRQNAALEQDYLCQGGMVAGKVEAMLERIRHKHPLSP
jgi:CNP1-like family